MLRRLCGPRAPVLLQLEGAWLEGGAQVRIEDLVVRYRGPADVIRGIGLSFREAQKVGIAGKTGCGKSTLLLSLLRIVEPCGGRVLLNGLDTATVGLTTLRRNVGLVPQDPVVFSGSLRQNLDPFGHFTEEQLWQALRQVQLAEHVESLPGRLDHGVACGGGNLSMGQRQLICLARMVLRQPGLLLLDEATSAIDPHTQQMLHASILSVFQRCTLVAVAHRLETLLAFDHCVVMDHGLVIEQGSPEDLVKAGGVFAGMLAAGRKP